MMDFFKGVILPHEARHVVCTLSSSSSPNSSCTLSETTMSTTTRDMINRQKLYMCRQQRKNQHKITTNEEMMTSLPSSSSSKNCCFSSSSSSALPSHLSSLTGCSSSNRGKTRFFATVQTITFNLLLILAICSTLTQTTLASDASYSVLQPVRSSHICFLQPQPGRDDRVTVERWFYNAPSRQCESYQLELNSIDETSRYHLNDFSSHKACTRFCAKPFRNLTDEEIAGRSIEAPYLVAEWSRSNAPLIQQQKQQQQQQQMLLATNKPSKLATPYSAPTIIVSNIDAKSRREHNSGTAPPRNRDVSQQRNYQNEQKQNEYQQQPVQESVWSSQAYKQGRKTSSSTSSSSKFFAVLWQSVLLCSVAFALL